MGLFHRNESDANFAGGSRNVLESIQSAMDTGTLMYVDNRVDFNTNSVITVRPNELAIFIKNGELYGILPSGRHELKNENYPVLSRLRNMLAGGMSTFTCEIIWVRTNEQNVSWGTASHIQIQDYFLGGGKMGVPVDLSGNGVFRVRFDINENEDASIQAFMRLMGDKSAYSVNDLSVFFQAQMSSEISDVIGKALEERSKRGESISAISSQLKDFAKEITPSFSELFKDYGFELVNFSFGQFRVLDTPDSKQIRARLTAAANVGNSSYNTAVAQELLGNLSVNEGAGGVASAGAGMGMGMAAGGAFASMAASAFSQPQPQMPQQPMGFGSGNRFGAEPTQTPNPAQPDPMETLTKMKKMLDAGLITQEIYDAKVAEVMSRM